MLDISEFYLSLYKKQNTKTMDKTHIDISTIEGEFTLELKNNLDNGTAFYDVYRHDDDGIWYMGELDPYCADCDFDEIDTCDEDFLNAIEDILIDAIYNNELYPHKPKH